MRDESPGRRRRLRPSSLRARLAVLFAIGSGAVLIASAGFLYVNLDRELERAINQGLAVRADDIASDLRAGSAKVRQEDVFAQILDGRGAVIDSSFTIPPGRRVLSATELRAALVHQIVVDRGQIKGLAEHVRLLARPERVRGSVFVVVVGGSRDTAVRARERLALVLFVASPLLMATLAGGGWLVAGGALRPVRRMTREANAISLADIGRRLAEPVGEDEIAQLGQTLNAMLDRIEASYRHERAFLDDASHELRTPIAILRGELEVALMRSDDPAGMEASLRSALEEAEQLSRLADDLLVLARVDSGQPSPRRQPVDLRALAARLGTVAQGAVAPVAEVRGEPAVARGDPAELERVVVNLVENARRFSRRRVLVETARSDGMVTLTVADDGPGFPPALLPVVFDRFTRGDASRGRGEGGTGLGLALVAAIVRSHGGTVAAANGPPLGGAVVRVVLPGGEGATEAP